MSYLVNYRQRSASEIIDASFSLYRANFALIALVSLSVASPPAILLLFLSPRPGLATVFVNTFVANMLIPLGAGIIAALVFADLSGTPVLLHEVLARLGRRFGTMLIYQWASGVMVLLGFLMLILPGIYFFIWTAVGVPVIAILLCHFFR